MKKIEKMKQNENSNQLTIFDGLDYSLIETLSPATRKVYSIMVKKRKAKYIEKKSGLRPRTIRKALKQLIDLKLIIKIPDLYDTRSVFYIKSCYFNSNLFN